MMTISASSKISCLTAVLSVLTLLSVTGCPPRETEDKIWYVMPGGTGDGRSWASAFGSIQDAADAADNDGGGEVWVAAGTYTGTAATIVIMRTGVNLYGGFNGTETARSQRYWGSNPTIIDGEGVRRCVGGASGAVLDGFVLQNGNSTYGGGMCNITCAPTVANCTFTHNTGMYGLGMYNDNSSPDITNCTFSYNTGAGAVGGGIYNDVGSAPSVDACYFQGNDVSYGGGVYSFGASPTLTNCLFFDNVCTAGGGGGLYSSSGSPTVINCTFSKNSGGYGGAIFNGNAALMVKNSILWGNTAISGGNEIHNTGTPAPDVTYSCVEGGVTGIGNSLSNPAFVDGTNNNFTLQATSLCIDLGTSSGAPAKDIMGVARPQGIGYDMGAYEYTGF